MCSLSFSPSLSKCNKMFWKLKRKVEVVISKQWSLLASVWSWLFLCRPGWPWTHENPLCCGSHDQERTDGNSIVRFYYLLSSHLSVAREVSVGSAVSFHFFPITSFGPEKFREGQRGKKVSRYVSSVLFLNVFSSFMNFSCMDAHILQCV